MLRRKTKIIRMLGSKIKLPKNLIFGHAEVLNIIFFSKSKRCLVCGGASELLLIRLLGWMCIFCYCTYISGKQIEVAKGRMLFLDAVLLTLHTMKYAPNFPIERLKL